MKTGEGRRSMEDRHRWEFQNVGVNMAEYIVYLKGMVSRKHGTMHYDYIPI